MLSSHLLTSHNLQIMTMVAKKNWYIQANGEDKKEV